MLLYIFYISFDDKAYLRPGTDVGAKGARKQVVLQSTDLAQCRTLPEHDFSEKKLHLTPGSFRYMTKKKDDCTGKLIRDMDQSAVMVRPKFYIPSTGSVWASDQVRFSHEFPHLYEIEQAGNETPLPVRKLCAPIHDYMSYFLDTYDEKDVLRVEAKGGIHKEYETKRLEALIRGLEESLELSVTDDIDNDQLCEYSQKANLCLESAKSVHMKMKLLSGRSLIKAYVPILNYCSELLEYQKVLNLPDQKSVILELTDAGPGVGVSNFEVRFRTAELSRLHNSERRTRVHRSRGDSAQNESERCLCW